MNVNLHHLALFETIARSDTITRAADSLMISQPAVSKQLRQLEQSLGVPLVERGAKRIRLTEAGQAVAAIARQIVTLANDVPGVVADLHSLRRGRLRIAASPSIATYLLPDLLIRFTRKFPGVRLHIETENSLVLTERLASGALDVGLSESLIRSPGIVCQIFAQDEMTAIVPGDHPLARRSTTLRRFLAEPLIVHDPIAGIQSQVQQAIFARHIDLRPAFSLPSTEAMKRAVAAGLGVAIIPRMTAGAEFRSNQLAKVALKDFSLHRPLYRCSPAGASQTKAMIAFDCLLKHAVRGTLPPLKKPASPRESI